MRPNPEDNNLTVRFYKDKVQNMWKSEQEGRPIWEMADLIEVQIPGNSTLIQRTLATDYYKRRFPDEWKHFQDTEGAVEMVSGTPLSEWPILNTAQVQELRYFKFFTVEQIAGASDLQINGLGMAGGLSPMVLRDKAKAYLSAARDSAASQALIDERRRHEQDIADLKAEIARLSSAQAEKRGPGRPRKEVAEA